MIKLTTSKVSASENASKKNKSQPITQLPTARQSAMHSFILNKFSQKLGIVEAESEDDSDKTVEDTRPKYEL